VPAPFLSLPLCSSCCSPPSLPAHNARLRQRQQGTTALTASRHVLSACRGVASAEPLTSHLRHRQMSTAKLESDGPPATTNLTPDPSTLNTHKPPSSTSTPNHKTRTAMANSKPPLPPPAIAYLCDVQEEQTKGCGPAGTSSQTFAWQRPLPRACTGTLTFQKFLQAPR
jgi:hypothetical protein